MSVARDLAAKILSAATRALVTASDTTQKMQSLMVQDFEGDDAYEAELVEPVGVSFRAPIGAEVIIVSPDGEPANAVAIVASSRDQRPTVDIAEGEGGLYLEGVYRVFLAADGTVHLGEQEGADFVALAAKVDAELSALKTAYDMHTHPHSMGPTGPVTVPLVPFNAVGATKVKAT